MKHIIFTYNRYDTISTSQYLNEIDHLILCHTQEQKKQFEDAGRCLAPIIATGQPKGLSNNRNVALDMLADGEWAVFWVDDLIQVTCLNNYAEVEAKQESLGITAENQPHWRQELKAPCDVHQFNTIAQKTIEHAEQKGLALCGFSLTNNALFRDNHYSYHSLADGRCWLVKKTKLRFDTNVQLIDDTCFTALNLKTFGGVVVNNWLLPDCERYTPGSFGTKEDRMEQKIQECTYLVNTYPDFICHAEKVGWPHGSHVKIRQKKVNHNQITMF